MADTICIVENRHLHVLKISRAFPVSDTECKMENGLGSDNDKPKNRWGSDECLSGEAKDKTAENLLTNEEGRSPDGPSLVGLQRKLGLVSGICLIVGTMIGSGILLRLAMSWRTAALWD